MKACVTTLPVGTHFLYDGYSWVVASRDCYPFIEAKCETEPNEYEGLNVLFTNFQKVEVPDNTKLWIPKFVLKGDTYVMEEVLQ